MNKKGRYSRSEYHAIRNIEAKEARHSRKKALTSINERIQRVGEPKMDTIRIVPKITDMFREHSLGISYYMLRMYSNGNPISLDDAREVLLLHQSGTMALKIALKEGVNAGLWRISDDELICTPILTVCSSNRISPSFSRRQECSKLIRSWTHP